MTLSRLFVSTSLILALATGCKKDTPPVATETTPPTPDVAAPAAFDTTTPPAPDIAPGADATPPTPDVAADTGGPDATPPADGGPTDTQPAGPIEARTPEEAVRFYYEGTRDRDAKKLWAIMSGPARKALEGVKASAVKAPDEELARVGLERSALEAMDLEQFFAAMVKATPVPEVGRFDKPPSEVTVEGEGSARKVRFALGPARCEAEVVEEGGLWKVESSRCEEGG